jgi:hypothetical protein
MKLITVLGSSRPSLWKSKDDLGLEWSGDATSQPHDLRDGSACANERARLEREHGHD